MARRGEEELRFRADPGRLRLEYDCSRCREAFGRRSRLCAAASSWRSCPGPPASLRCSTSPWRTSFTSSSSVRSSFDSGQAASPGRADGAAHRASLPSAGDGETRGAVPEGKDLAPLSRRRLAAQAASGQRAAVGCEPARHCGVRRMAEAPKPMIGFGDPVFDPTEPVGARGAAGAPGSAAPASPAPIRNCGGHRASDRTAGQFSRRSGHRRRVEAVAIKLGATCSDLHLRERANEVAVKRAALANYRVVYFATHGLVAGDVRGIASLRWC